MSNIEVRTATPDDATAMAEVLFKAFVAYQPLYTPEAFAATTPTHDQLRHRLDEGPVWVAIQNGAIVGTVGAKITSEGLYIRSMAVLPAARGQGVARQLLKQIEQFAEAHDQRRMFLSTTPFLTEAIRLYESWGFQRSGEGPHELFGTPLFTMVKGLV